MIPYGKQNISQADIDAVVEALRSDWITQGPAVDTFEKHIRDYTGAQHAVAMSSATAALHIACLALGLGKGDRLWTSPNSFVASANCALYCGAQVDFVDIEADTFNMSVDALRARLELARANDSLPGIVVPVHFAGQSCDMQAIHELSREYGFRIIEDASHAIGGRYQDRPIGDCRYADITVFSFHPVKIITTGEGGVACCNDEDIAARMTRLRSHGITRDTSLFDGEADGAWDYQQIELGFNYRITDMQCALGSSQMQRLDEFIAARHRHADHYDDMLAELPVITPLRKTDRYSALHLYVVQLEQDDAALRRRVFDAMREAGIGVNIHYIPVHTQPWYQRLGFRHGDFPVAERYYRRCISLPMFYDLDDSQQRQVVEALEQALA